MKFYNSFLSIFKNFNVLIQLFLFTLLLFLVGEVLESLFIAIYKKDISKIDFGNSSIECVFFEVVFLAPLLETFLIQFLLLEFLLLIFSKLKEGFFFSILISGLIFGILHQYNVAYMIALTILGWIFGFIYSFYKINKRINPFLGVLITHTLYNLIILLKDYNTFTRLFTDVF